MSSTSSTSSTTTTPPLARRPLTKRNKVGLALAGILGLTDIPSFLISTPDGSDAPPLAVLVLTSICGIVTIAAVITAWRSSNRTAVRVAAGARVLSAVLAVPALFADIPAGLAAAAAVFVIVTVVSLVLMLTPDRGNQIVTD